MDQVFRASLTESSLGGYPSLNGECEITSFYKGSVLSDNLYPSRSGDQNPQCESDHKNRFVFRQEVKNLPAPVKPTLPGQNATVCLRIYTQQDDSKMSSALQALRSLTHLANMSEITYEPQQGRARFSLSFNRTSQRIEITDEMKRTLPRTLPRSTSVFEFRDIFHGIGFYDYYLRRSEPDLAGIVTVSIYNAAYDGSRNGHNLVQGGADIDIVEDGSYFVIELRNQTSRDLYPTLFCFDSSEFSIRESVTTQCL